MFKIISNEFVTNGSFSIFVSTNQIADCRTIQYQWWANFQLSTNQYNEKFSKENQKQKNKKTQMSSISFIVDFVSHWKMHLWMSSILLMLFCAWFNRLHWNTNNNKGKKPSKFKKSLKFKMVLWWKNKWKWKFSILNWNKITGNPSQMVSSWPIH